MRYEDSDARRAVNNVALLQFCQRAVQCHLTDVELAAQLRKNGQSRTWSQTLRHDHQFCHSQFSLRLLPMFNGTFHCFEYQTAEYATDIVVVPDLSVAEKPP